MKTWQVWRKAKVEGSIKMAEINWLILALLDAFFAALVAIFAKMGLQNVDANVATMIRTAIMMVFMILVVVLTGKTGSVGNISSEEGLFILLSGIAGALSWLLYFAALRIGDVSKVAAVDRSSLLFVIVLSFAVLNEGLNLKTIVAAILIFAGLLIIAI
jgi:bacterial/archaeal transporter family protein